MRGSFLLKLIAWAIAITLVALPIVGVLNGWFASDRWPVTKLDVRAAVAKLPWVERAEARKRWPDVIELTVYEQQPYARWGDDRLINRHGNVFKVSGTDGLQGLPELSGPDDRLDEVIEFHADCLKEFSGSGLIVTAVALSPRGGWTIRLASGASIAVGRDHPRERLARFLDAWPKLAAGHADTPAYVDLRYANGFAVRWGAGSTPATTTPAKPLADSRLRIPNPESRIPAFTS